MSLVSPQNMEYVGAAVGAELGPILAVRRAIKWVVYTAQLAPLFQGMAKIGQLRCPDPIKAITIFQLWESNCVC